jgi:hypothetical protein
MKRSENYCSIESEHSPASGNIGWSVYQGERSLAGEEFAGGTKVREEFANHAAIRQQDTLLKGNVTSLSGATSNGETPKARSDRFVAKPSVVSQGITFQLVRTLHSFSSLSARKEEPPSQRLRRNQIPKGKRVAKRIGTACWMRSVAEGERIRGEHRSDTATERCRYAC